MTTTVFDYMSATPRWLIDRIERCNDEKIIALDSIRRRRSRGTATLRIERAVVQLDDELLLLSRALLTRPRSLSRHG